ncbi:RNA polymerase sigma factor [Sphingomonas sp.]|uniref:RNA polymerase sigma factor n=1 Tax=Sphingomonas sp. TaxID=28214 RepID=UPI003D6D4185
MRLNLDGEPLVGKPIAEADPLPPVDRVPRAPAAELDLLYRAYWHKLLRFVRRRGPPDLAPDIVQQLFVRLTAQAVDAMPAIRAPDAYLQQAARNLIRDEARAAERRSAHLHICLDDVPLAAHDPIAALEARDMLQRFEASVARLDPRTREIFLAHRIDGFSYGEIALRTGLHIKTVEKHMSRAIAFLGRQFRR